MRAMSSFLLFAVGLAVLPSSAMADDPATKPVTLAPAINATDFARYEKTLSSDEFGGRKPGTAGEQRTLDFLVGEFKRMGLQPAITARGSRPCRRKAPCCSMTR